MSRLWSVAALLILAFLSFAGAAKAQEPAPSISIQNSIWKESRIGHIVVGQRDTKSGPVATLSYGYYFAAIGPEPTKETERFGDCLKLSADDAAAEFRRSIIQNHDFHPEELAYDDEQVDRTERALANARAKYESSTRTRCNTAKLQPSLAKYLDGMRLALVRRECGPETCDGLPIPTGSATSEGIRRQQTFEALYYWAIKKNQDTALGTTILLDFAKDKGFSFRTIEARPALNWPKPLDSKAVERMFEDRVKAVKAGLAGVAISATAASQMKIPRANVRRIAYAFDDAAAAYDLAPDIPEIAFASLQDEIARTRLYECANYRGDRVVDHVAQCAGYKITEPELISCLAGDHCLPTFDQAADVGAMLLSSANIEDLASQAVIPRPFRQFDDKDLEAAVSEYRACATANRAEDQIKACMGLKQIPPEIQKSANCFLDNKVTNKLECVAVSKDDAARLEALKKCAGDANPPSCAVKAALPAEVQCVIAAKKPQDLTCAAGSVGTAGAIAVCFTSAPNDFEKARCIMGDKLPKEAGLVANCFSKNSDPSALLVCSASGALPAEQALFVRCAAQSGFNPMGTGVCAAGSFLHLNPGQQIILQCAAAGGTPPTMAVCVIGQFTFRELAGCRTASFGQSGCFGEGNELQKLAKALTGSNISSKSVVGQLLVLHIDAANAAITGVGNALKNAAHGAQVAGKSFDHELRKFRERPLKSIGDAPRNIGREAGRLGGNIKREAHRACTRIYKHC